MCLVICSSMWVTWSKMRHKDSSILLLAVQCAYQLRSHWPSMDWLGQQDTLWNTLAPRTWYFHIHTFRERVHSGSFKRWILLGDAKYLNTCKCCSCLTCLWLPIILIILIPFFIYCCYLVTCMTNSAFVPVCCVLSGCLYHLRCIEAILKWTD